MYSLKEKYLPQITLKGLLCSQGICGNLSLFVIHGGLIQGLTIMFNATKQTFNEMM